MPISYQIPLPERIARRHSKKTKEKKEKRKKGAMTLREKAYKQY